jgi:hypothetical protein
MINLAPVIAPRSDQLNYDDLVAGPRTIRIRDVKVSEGEQPLSIFYDGDNGKPWKPCKSMARLLVFIWCEKGNPDATVFIGKSLTLKGDPTVTFGRDAVGGIRVSNMSGITSPITVLLMSAKRRRQPYTVEPLIIEQPKQKQHSPNVEQEAQYAAERGMDELKTFWSQLTKAQQRALQPRMEKLKQIASEADASDADDSSEPASNGPTIDATEAGAAPTVSASQTDGDF